MTDVFVKAENHRGTSLIEILQNCVIFNDKVFSNVTAKEVRDDSMLWVEHGKPMIFGKDGNKGIIVNGLKLEVAEIGKNGVTEKDILVHDAHSIDNTLHGMLVCLTVPEFPVVFGVIRDVNEPTYDHGLLSQIDEVTKSSSLKKMDDLLLSGETWEIK